MYQHASSLPEGKQDPEFVKKPDIALKLIDKCLSRGEKPGVVLVDAGYGNNSNFLKQLELNKLKYIAGLAKNRKVICQLEPEKEKVTLRLDELAKSLKPEAFTGIQLEVELPRTVWVATVEVEMPAFVETRTIAIVMNAASLAEATEVNYLITNVAHEKATCEWIIKTYSQRNWVEVFYREALMMVRFKRISDAKYHQPSSTFDISFLCLQFYYLATINGRFKTALGE